LIICEFSVTGQNWHSGIIRKWLKFSTLCVSWCCGILQAVLLVYLCIKWMCFGILHV